MPETIKLREIRCKYCHTLQFRIKSDGEVYLEFKCRKCGKISRIRLVKP